MVEHGRQVGCYWKQLTMGSYDDEIRPAQLEPLSADRSGAVARGLTPRPKTVVLLLLLGS